jgi:hypothetical protein
VIAVAGGILGLLMVRARDFVPYAAAEPAREPAPEPVTA